MAVTRAKAMIDCGGLGSYSGLTAVGVEGELENVIENAIVELLNEFSVASNWGHHLRSGQ